MNTSKLLEYLSICIDLEKNKLTIQNIMEHIDKNIEICNNEIKANNLKITNSIYQLEQKEDALKNYKPKNNREYGCTSLFLFYIGISLIIASISLGKEMQNIYVTITGGLFVIILCYVFPIMRAHIGAIKNKKNVESDLQIYTIRTQEEVQKRSKRNQTVQNNVIAKYQSEKNEFKKTYQLTCQTLQKYYDANVIPSKYRSLVPICMFYDYIITGRTYSLKKDLSTFDEGAINIYEDELFKKEILCKLDVIIDRLDNINENQKILYDTIKQSQAQTHKLLTSIDMNISKTNNHLQTIEYQNAQRNKCLEYISYVVYQKYHY